MKCNVSLIMMTSSNGNIFRVTGPLCGEFTGPGEFPTQRPVTRNFDVFFDLRLNKRLSKQPWGWWFETPSWSLWRHRNDVEWILLWLRHGMETLSAFVPRIHQSPQRTSNSVLLYLFLFTWTRDWTICGITVVWNFETPWGSYDRVIS